MHLLGTGVPSLQSLSTTRLLIEPLLARSFPDLVSYLAHLETGDTVPHTPGGNTLQSTRRVDNNIILVPSSFAVSKVLEAAHHGS